MQQEIKYPEGFNHFFIRCIYENTKRKKVEKKCMSKLNVKG